MDGWEEQGKNARSNGGRKEGILDDLTGLIRLLVPEGGLTKSPKSPGATCYPL